MTDKLIPGEPLIYERVDGVVYARYRDRPDIKRWIIGGEYNAIARARGEIPDWREMTNLQELAQKYPTLRKQLDKTLELYYLLKDAEEET